MKKILFLAAVLLVVFSGVSAVSAYEGHLIDIKAHVENAIGVNTIELNMGTVFPQEVFEAQIPFGLSQSFMSSNQLRLSSVNYELAWELKPGVGATPLTSANPLYLGSYYEPLNPFLKVTSLDGTFTTNGNVNTVPAPGAAVVFATGQLTKIWPSGYNTQSMDYVHLTFSVPVFQGYYNSITDPTPTNWVYGMLNNGQFVTATENISNGTQTLTAPVPNADLGIDLKIQVTGFVPHM
jgi:hypothetical protein